MRRKTLFTGALVTVVLLAAIIGGGYAIFSDNVASDDQYFTAGTVDITVDNEDKFFETTLDMWTMEPGDCEEQIVTVRNVGTLPVDLWNWIYTWHEDDGFPNIFACDPNDDCNMDVVKSPEIDRTEPWDKLYPICSYALGSAIPIYEPCYEENDPDFEQWTLTACLPLCAGNECQEGTGTMRMFFHAVQQSNLEEGWDCVKLLYKEGPLWIPDPTIPAHGNKCYEASVGEGPDVDFVVNGYDMTPNMPLQIMLNGPGGCSPEDLIIAGDTDGDLASDSCDLYYRAFWNGTPTGGAMSCKCDPTTSGEGVYAIAHGGDYHLPPIPGATTDANGNFSGQWTAELDACAIYGAGPHTLQTKFLVKQDASPWLEELDELDYQYITFNCPTP